MLLSYTGARDNDTYFPVDLNMDFSPSHPSNLLQPIHMPAVPKQRGWVSSDLKPKKDSALLVLPLGCQDTVEASLSPLGAHMLFHLFFLAAYWRTSVCSDAQPWSISASSLMYK